MQHSTQASIGFGVLGLHEGRTLLKALGETNAGPTSISPLQRARHAVAVAGCDRDPAKLAEARRERPDLAYTTSYEEMLAMPEVQVVAIYTPDHLHAEHAEQALRAGKHVLCTKPLVTTVDDARRLLAAGRETGGRLLVGQSTRFFEPFARQRAAFERGEIGDLELLDAHYLHRMDWFYAKSPWAAETTDWAFLGLSHPVDLARWYLGRIARVQAFGSTSALGRRYGLKGYDVYSVNLLAADGRVGRVLGNYGLHELPRARNAIELMLYGAGGSSLAQYHDMRYLHTASDGTEVVEDSLYALRGYYFNNEVHGMHYGEFANYAEHFATALLEGGPHHPDLGEGIESFCVMEAARQSALAGGRVVEVAGLLEAVGF